MKDQTLKSEVNLLSILATLLGCVLVVLLVLLGIHQFRLSDPYIREVLSIEGNVERGHAIFQMNCTGCHGLNAAGHVGPSLRRISDRRSQVGLIQQVTSGNTPPMPKFQASPAEMADLLSYLNTL